MDNVSSASNVASLTESLREGIATEMGAHPEGETPDRVPLSVRCDHLQRLLDVVEIVEAMDLKCQVYGNLGDLTCIDYDTADDGRRMGIDELCDNCKLWEAVEALGR